MVYTTRGSRVWRSGLKRARAHQPHRSKDLAQLKWRTTAFVTTSFQWLQPPITIFSHNHVRSFSLSLALTLYRWESIILAVNLSSTRKLLNSNPITLNCSYFLQIHSNWYQLMNSILFQLKFKEIYWLSLSFYLQHFFLQCLLWKSIVSSNCKKFINN